MHYYGVHHSSRLLEILYKPYISSCDTTWGCIHQLLINNSHTFNSFSFSRLSPIFIISVIPSSLSSSTTNSSVSGIAESRAPAEQPEPIPPIYTTAKSRRTNPFLHRVESLGATLPHLIVKRLSFSRVIPLWSRMFAIFSYFLISTRSGRATLVFTSLGIRWNTRLLQGSSLWMGSNTRLDILRLSFVNSGRA